MDSDNSNMLLTYLVQTDPAPLPVSTATAAPGKLVIIVAPSATVRCHSITIEIPTGEAADALFQGQPLPTVAQEGWTHDRGPRHLLRSMGAAQEPPPSKLTIFKLLNPDPKGSVADGLRVTISGDVSLVLGTALITIIEESTADSTHSFTYKTQKIPVEKAAASAFYIKNFCSTSADSDSPVPVSEFANGDKIRLSWESNGTAFCVYQKGKTEPVWSDKGTALKSCDLPGVSTDTTFILKATLSKGTESPDLYEALTVTVSNPSLTPNKVDVSGPVTIASGNVLEFGAGVAGKEQHAGKIGYGTFDGVSLNIVGAGTQSNERKIRFWNEGGASFNGNVGIGTTTPSEKLAVMGGGGGTVDLTVNGRLCTGDANNSGGVWLDSGKTQFVGQYNATTMMLHNNNWRMVMNSEGNVGIDNDKPTCRLDLGGKQGDKKLAVYSDSGSFYGFGVNEGKLKLSSGGSSDDPKMVIQNNGNVGIGTKDAITKLDVAGSVRVSGYVGIGTTTTPGFPLHVVSLIQCSFGGYGFTNVDGPGYVKDGTNSLDVSIKAEHRIVASEFDAISDVRLKTVIGLSDHAADLALLRRLRITDYTMRDQVQYGDKAFKKIIAQELEEVFPQAVSQHISFLPDIYARPSQVQQQGDALLLILPAGLPEATTAGQRLKLIGPTGEVVATLAEAAKAGSQQLVVTGATSLAETPDEVFIFGLERPDVRTVDYDAVAMLHVSATQALAQQVEALHQQNATLQAQSAALHEQLQAQRAECSQTRAALEHLQAQVAFLLSAPVAAIGTPAFAPSAS